MNDYSAFAVPGTTEYDKACAVQKPQQTHADETQVRVDRVRRAVDPTGLFAGDTPRGDKA
ncbi:hypothetical protein GCM10029976_009550 [Kribbella albertanoniae]|uniref:Uncharacterized protein n=1 Tax=Kribbella albertanoniae TaxID=1266829 RepID=A0A4R4QE02_9ACTN|nr:hypothetical protein [Kribbella albertanoniae]TDC33660.1 hypothetical protein E1261_05525 [Kribbella albertanoniae]